VTLSLLLSGGEDEHASGAPTQPDAAPSSTPSQHDRNGNTAEDTAGDEAVTPEQQAVDEVAEKIVSALNESDTESAESIACDPDSVGSDFGSHLPVGATVQLAGSPAVDGDQARIPVEYVGHGSPTKTEIPLQRDGDAWCVVMQPEQ